MFNEDFVVQREAEYMWEVMSEEGTYVMPAVMPEVDTDYIEF